MAATTGHVDVFLDSEEFRRIVGGLKEAKDRGEMTTGEMELLESLYHKGELAFIKADTSHPPSRGELHFVLDLSPILRGLAEKYGVRKD